MARTTILLLACVLLAAAQVDLSNKNVIYRDGIDRNINIEAVTKKLPVYTVNRDAQINARCGGGSACGSLVSITMSFLLLRC